MSHKIHYCSTEVLLLLWHPGIQRALVTEQSLCPSDPSGPPCSRQSAYTEGSDMLYSKQENLVVSEEKHVHRTDRQTKYMIPRVIPVSVVGV